MDRWLIYVYCLLILLASLSGGILPLMLRLNHTTIQFAVSFVAGVMLGVALLHMIPHATRNLAPSDAMIWVLGGFLIMFFIQRYLVVHQHVAPHEQSAHEHRCGESDEVHHHDHEDFPSHTSGKVKAKIASGGVVLGLSLHTLLNGVALASAVESPSKGFAAFIAILIHKPFDSLTITTLMAADGWSKRACHIVNFLFSLAIPIGVGLFYLGLGLAGAARDLAEGCALAASAGVFLCIAASDLLPEMHFHSHDRSKLSFWLLLGVALAYVIENLLGG